MNDDQSVPLVILAGGQSLRMGEDKAVMPVRGERMIDRIINRFKNREVEIYISADQDYGTGLVHVADDPDSPAGPVGAIFSLSRYFSEKAIHCGFYTVPVDAPFAPNDLTARLANTDGCAVAAHDGQLHPTFAYWQCSVVEAIRATHDPGANAPSLHWLSRQCGVRVIEWADATELMNINKPEDLKAAEELIKKAGA